MGNGSATATLVTSPSDQPVPSPAISVTGWAKPPLVLTLKMVGAATFLIGLVPTYAAIEVDVLVITVVLRLLQDLRTGGK